MICSNSSVIVSGGRTMTGGASLDAVAAVDVLGELRQRPQARSRVGLGQRLARGLHRGLVDRRGKLGDHFLGVEACVPDVEEAHMARLGHRRAIRGGGGAGRGGLFLATMAIAASGDDDAGHQALDVPLERRRQCLVEVVEVEHERAVGGGEHAEVRQVRVATALHAQACARGARQVSGHDRRAAAIERERGDDHPPVPDRHQLGHPRRVLCLENADRVGTVSRSPPLGVGLQRHRLAFRAPLGQTILDRLRALAHAAGVLSISLCHRPPDSLARGRCRLVRKG